MKQIQLAILTNLFKSLKKECDFISYMLKKHNKIDLKYKRKWKRPSKKFYARWERFHEYYIHLIRIKEFTLECAVLGNSPLDVVNIDDDTIDSLCYVIQKFKSENPTKSFTYNSFADILLIVKQLKTID